MTLTITKDYIIIYGSKCNTLQEICRVFEKELNLDINIISFIDNDYTIHDKHIYEYIYMKHLSKNLNQIINILTFH